MSENTEETGSENSKKLNDSVGDLDDSLLLDPFQESFQRGREEGHKKGLQRGFDEGYLLGCKKAWEYHFELGYYSSFVSEVASEMQINLTDSRSTALEQVSNGVQMLAMEDAVNSSLQKSERIARNVRSLLHEIKSFPNADEILPSEDDKNESYSGEVEVEALRQPDIALLMQRIRAKVCIFLIHARCHRYEENLAQSSSCLPLQPWTV